MNQRIIYSNDEGGVSIIVPALECGLTIEEIAAKDVPAGTDYEIVDVSEIPSDRTFRNAWEKSGKAVVTNLNKAKGIAHEKRRATRAEEFEPHDDVIAKQIPGKDSQAAEAARQAVRDKYAAMQDQIDAAQTVEELIAVMPKDEL
jgi:hypothetical protein